MSGPIATGTNGANQTVAIVDAYAAGTIEDDANQYSSGHGLPPVNLSQIWAVPNLDNKSGDDGSHCGGPAGWYGEETLDVEAVHSMAPGANILYSGGQNCLDPALVSAVVRVLDDGSAHIVSNSYGDTGEGTTAKEAAIENEVYKQAAAEGIGLYFSAGDDGDESTTIGHVEADFPATIPWVTAVGGTSLAVGSSDNYLFETGWGTGKSALTSGAWDPAPPGAFLYGSGGGTSKLFAQPPYQQGVVNTSLSGTPAMRVIPDIAADGDPNTGMLVGETQTFPKHKTAYGEYRIGGTSLSSPLVAGMMAVADQAAGFYHGFVNPALYLRNGSSAFRDVQPSNGQLAVVRNDFVNGIDASAGVATSLRSLDHDSSLTTANGYDNVTGLGTPNGASFLSSLSTP
jgi:subtilase family serine protease